MGIAREADVGYKDHQLLQAAELPVQNTKTKPEEDHFNFMKQKKILGKKKEYFSEKTKSCEIMGSFCLFKHVCKTKKLF